ncbi:hypothetical protein ALTERO38_60455 [Alteromonas sp. 38]|nr:hypothetical protein ALTER154_40340 [Alteromonas sp. 154]VXC22217.1 hypothetical protein ALTERO38_60455 [Alteromonas sp. 38]
MVGLSERLIYQSVEGNKRVFMAVIIIFSYLLNIPYCTSLKIL